MNSEQNDSPLKPESNGTSSDRDQELTRLRETVKRLEQERDECKTMLSAALRQLFTVEELTRIPDEKDCLPLEAFIEELEAIVDRH